MSRQLQQAWNEQFCGTTHCIRVCQKNRYTTNSNWNGRSFQNTVNRAVRSAGHHITCWEVLNRDLLLADHVNKCPHSDKSTNNNRRKDRWSHVLSSFACTFSVRHTHTHTHPHISLEHYHMQLPNFWSLSFGVVEARGSWLRQWATSREVAGSIPDAVNNLILTAALWLWGRLSL